ncbi:TIGR02281 family clan AA aspartic protease [Phenylobacterium sp. J367]|uniref:TIGR02281 family clan AA aspartic protease n=1 Tax=Phenylobacterium sp. J367 TaxID=2898435 RepID=UPI002150B7AB|nr:TIGR02281 family clan AA aspartic protease [Phenylobacterium sp. J367]MCR5881012.1 TIGR02281 family clan AA aspartic protease [Phenylobacterium sp. J367]
MSERASSLVRYALVAFVASASAFASAGAVVAFAPKPPQLRAARAEAAMVMPLAADPAAGERAEIPKAADGHYWAQAEVNGQAVRFLVDTGATAVALTPNDAQRLGIRIEQLKFDYTVGTAAGRTRAAPVRLASVSVDGARIENVDALVIEEGLDSSLLGMTYLGRLSSFQATRQALFLQP